MEKVFWPQPTMKNGEVLSVDGDTYRVMSQGKVVSSGELLTLDELYEHLILIENKLISVENKLILYYNKDIDSYCLSKTISHNHFNPKTGNWDYYAVDCWLKDLTLLLKITEEKLEVVNFEYRSI